MTTPLFNAGDVVRLKSGGHPMTVEIADSEGIVCVWTDREKKFRRERVAVAALTPSDGEFDGVGDLIFEDYHATLEDIAENRKNSGLGNA